MQKLSSLGLALSVGAFSFQVASPARAAETAAQKAGRAAITRAYAQQDVATVKKDVPTLMAFLAPDYQMHTSTGRVLDRAQTEAMLRRALSGSMLGVPVSFSKVLTRITSLTWRGADAIVMTSTSGIVTARKPGARAVRIDQASTSRDFWSPTSQGWKARQTVETSSKMWVDGKRIR